jgi:hypothetical protein
LVHVFDASLLVKVVDHHDLAFLAFVGVELGQEFVLFDESAGVVQGLFDMELFVVFGFAEVYQKEVGLYSHGKLFGLDGH